MRSSVRAKKPGILLLAAMLLAAAAPGRSMAEPRIVNGLDTQGFPTTGALLYGGGAPIGESNAGVQCRSRQAVQAGESLSRQSLMQKSMVHLVMSP